MISKAEEIDPDGDYQLINESDLTQFKNNTFDLALSAFTFDNIPTMEKKIKNLKEITRLLNDEGIIVNLVSSPEIYTHEWASFSTKDYPENWHAKNGDRVKIIMTDVEDRRPVEDIVWTDEYYQDTYSRAGLETIKTYKPLAKPTEPYKWVNETTIAPWVIYVLKKKIKTQITNF
jgi:ubiquinone/menaquinone biosynthesis C-methylase UbiE